MDTRTVWPIQLTPGGDGVTHHLLIDDNEVRHCRSVNLRVAAGEITTAEVEIIATDVIYEGNAAVEVTFVCPCCSEKMQHRCEKPE